MEESSKLSSQVSTIENRLSDKEMFIETLQCEKTEMKVSLESIKKQLRGAEKQAKEQVGVRWA